MHARDVRNEAVLDGGRPEWTSVLAEDLEVRPTLAAVDATPDSVVCELGCGPGRYTLALAQSAAEGARQRKTTMNGQWSGARRIDSV